MYVDQILPNFDPQPPSSGQNWTFYILATLCHVTLHGLSTDPQPPLFFHLVIECPLLQLQYYCVVPTLQVVLHFLSCQFLHK